MLSKLTFSLALVLMLAFALVATPVIAQQVVEVDAVTAAQGKFVVLGGTESGIETLSHP